MTAESTAPPSPYGTPSRETAPRKPQTLHRLRALREAGEKIAMLTAYDAASARLLDDAGVDCLLVGDSLGMVMQGHASTLPVTLEQMVYHTQCVARGNRTAWLIADLPFGSYQGSTEQAIASSVALMQAGAQMIKLEGGGWTAPLVRALVERGIPVRARPIWLQTSAPPFPASPSASAREAAPTARCWCCTTCWTSPAAPSRALCATSWRAHPACSTRCTAMYLP